MTGTIDHVKIPIRRETMDLLLDQSEPGDTIDDRILHLIICYHQQWSTIRRLRKIIRALRSDHHA